MRINTKSAVSNIDGYEIVRKLNTKYLTCLPVMLIQCTNTQLHTSNKAIRLPTNSPQHMKLCSIGLSNQNLTENLIQLMHTPFVMSVILVIRHI